MTNLARFLCACAALAILLPVVGCGSGGLDCYSVTGTVKNADGSPLTKGQIIFDSGQLAARGQIKEDGTFTLYTGEDEGAPAGNYTVYFIGVDAPEYVPPSETGRTAPAQPAVQIDPKYLSKEKSDLQREVKAEPNTFDMVLGQ